MALPSPAESANSKRTASVRLADLSTHQSGNDFPPLPETWPSTGTCPAGQFVVDCSSRPGNLEGLIRQCFAWLEGESGSFHVPCFRGADVSIFRRPAGGNGTLGSALQKAPDRGWYHLRERFAHLGLAQGFDELLCMPHLHGIETFWYQVETVRKVLKQFRGRVLLADEVGLGKTVEAGMVLKEYALRGMVESVLVLAPASPVGQWREELETKFNISCATTHDDLLRDDPDRFWQEKRLIASIALAGRSEHAARLAGRSFDLVIVDEAHHLRDRASQSYKLVDALNKRFCCCCRQPRSRTTLPSFTIC
jgi:hypothetical protein